MPAKTWHALTFFTAVLITSTYSATPCPKQLTIDITNGRKLRNGVIYHSGVYFTKYKYFGEYVNSSYKIFGCICEYKKCFRKCCPFGQAFGTNGSCTNANKTVTESFQVPVFNLTEQLNVSANHFHVVINKDCSQGAYVLNPWEYGEDSHFLQSNGSLYQNYSGVQHPPETYCFEFFERENNVLPLVCFTEIPEEKDEYTGKEIKNRTVERLQKIPVCIFCIEKKRECRVY